MQKFVVISENISIVTLLHARYVVRFSATMRRAALGIAYEVVVRVSSASESSVRYDVSHWRTAGTHCPLYLGSLILHRQKGSPGRLRRILNSYGVRRHIAKRRPALTALQRRGRLAFARAHRNWTVLNWGRILFTDEKIFKATSSRRGEFVSRTRFEILHPDCISRVSKSGPQVHVWGAIGWRGAAPLILIRGSLNAEQYQRQVLVGLWDLGEQFAGFGRRKGPQSWFFQQDNAPAHMAHSTRDFLTERGIALMEWPSNSPDLNIIENLWGYVVHKMSHEPVHTSEELLHRVEEAWARIPYSLIRTLFKSMAGRIREVLKHRGHPTRYWRVY